MARSFEERSLPEPSTSSLPDTSKSLKRIKSRDQLSFQDDEEEGEQDREDEERKEEGFSGKDSGEEDGDANGSEAEEVDTSDVLKDVSYTAVLEFSSLAERAKKEKQRVATSTLPAHLLPASHSAGAGKKKAQEPGLIYLSRIPPGMGPSKVKHLLGNYGEVGRVFLARADKERQAEKVASNGTKNYKVKEKHQEHRFKEGWIEFLDKRIARSVADVLNARTIGGKKGSRWRDDVWTMVYLPRFRWDMLSEQVALERATQTSLLRFHLQHSKMEQESYLSAVEKARVKGKIEEKAEGRRIGRKARSDDTEMSPTMPEGKKARKPERERTYRQREVVNNTGKVGGDQNGLEVVLSRLF